MNRHLTLILLLFSMTAFGQIKLDGEFSNDDYHISFLNDSSFKYEYSQYEYSERGNGTFEVSDDTFLLLNFIDSLKNSFTINDTSCNSSDSVTLFIQILDITTHDPIQFAFVIIYQPSKYSKGAQADINGKTSIILERQSQEFSFKASYVGFKIFSYSIKPENCMDIVIYLTPTSYNIPKGKKLKYRIKKYDGKKLVLREETFSAPNIELRKTETKLKTK